MGGRQGPEEEGRQEEGRQEEGPREEESEEEVKSWFKRRKKFDEIEQQQLLESVAALSRNEHYRVLVEHIQDRRERSIRALQVEKVVESSNRHFMEAGKIEALDELLDDLEIMSNARLDDGAV